MVGDSAELVAKILKNVPRDKLVFAYLDAHWLDAIPTNQEIKHLIEWGGDWVAVIDDFLIASDPGYKFDSYGDKVIGLGIIPQNSELQVWIPRESSDLETGVRSGTGYVFSSAALAEGFPENVFRNLTRVR